MANELDWFSFQNWMRDTIHEIVTPISLQIEEDKQEQKSISKIVDKLTNKIEELEEQTKNHRKQLNDQQKLKDSIRQINDFMRSKENYTNEQFSKLQLLLQTTSEKVRVVQSDMGSFHSMANNSKNEVNKIQSY